MNSPPDLSGRAFVVVHGLEQALAVLRHGLPCGLLSARSAALSGGCLWWFELARQARASVPGVDVIDILDCADAAGPAMAALRIGQRVLVLDPGLAAFPAVAAAADSLGATVLGVRPAALDLGERGAARLLAAHLAGAAAL